MERNPARTCGHGELMGVYPASKENVKRAAAVIAGGGLVAFPTETVYGLGADALNPVAVARIFEVKNRPRFDPLIVHIADFTGLEMLVRDLGAVGRRLAEAFWPGPLTLVARKEDAVPDIVTAGLPTVAVRMPDHDVALELIRQAGTPVAAPSANPFGYLSPTDAAHVQEQLGEKVEMVLDGGQCSIGVESTIVQVDEGSVRLLRPGGLPLEEIEKITGPAVTSERSHDVPNSPGQWVHHYAPRTPVRIARSLLDIDPGGRRSGLLAFRDPVKPERFAHIEVLSPEGELTIAAARFFSCLHRLDKAGLDIIFAEAVPEIGLGRAIMNRLYKAEAGGGKG